MTTPDDARTALIHASERGIRNPRAEVTFIGESQVDAPTLAGVAASWALEHKVTGSGGEHVVQLMGASVGRVVFVLQASGWVDWSWDEVQTVAQAVALRIISQESVTSRD
jgi:hypothetical protein